MEREQVAARLLEAETEFRHAQLAHDGSPLAVVTYRAAWERLRHLQHLASLLSARPLELLTR